QLLPLAGRLAAGGGDLDGAVAVGQRAAELDGPGGQAVDRADRAVGGGRRRDEKDGHRREVLQLHPPMRPRVRPPGHSQPVARARCGVYSGMLPCLRGGLSWRLLARVLSERMMAARVSRGRRISSMYPSEAAL